MIVIPPITITDSMLTSSTAVETAPTAYSAGTTYSINDTSSVAGAAGLITIYKSLQSANTGNTPAISPTWWVSIGTTYQVYSGATTYALGDRVIDTTVHKVYESLLAGNVGNALTLTAKWLEIGADNKWAMFDLLRNTATVQPSSITVVITPGIRFDALALLGLVANSATINITSGGTNVYSKTIDLNSRDVSSWYDYFFKAFTTKKAFALFDLPPFTNAVITITLTATSGNAQCGACVIGAQENIGKVQYGAQSDVLNFSSVTRDVFGNSTLVARRNVPKTIQNIWLDKTHVNRVRTLRDSLNATPAVWSGLEDSTSDYFEALLILGIYKRFTLDLNYPTVANISLELEEI